MSAELARRACVVLLVLTGLAASCGRDAVEGEDPADCTDYIDNDGDRLIDCADPSCAAAPPCVEPEDTPPPADTGADDSGTVDTWTWDTGMEPSPYAGTYGGRIWWDIPRFSLTVCEGSVSLEVGEAGTFVHETTCFDRLLQHTSHVLLTGRVTAEGQVRGTIRFDTWEGGEPLVYITHEVPIGGSVVDDLLEAHFYSEVEVDGYGSQELDGRVRASR